MAHHVLNRAAVRITGYSRQEALGQYCWDIFRSNMCETDCALRRTMKQSKAFVDTATYIVNRDKRKIPVVVSTSLLMDEEGNVLGGVETFRDISQVEELRKELQSRFQVGDIVSRSPSMRRIFKILPQVAASDSTVLIQGETGTGKELFARAIHELSPRKDNSFVAINCGALPDTLLESELFGYKAGAFTNATRDKPGHFALAEGGTMLLDEIGDLSPAFQVRLLRVLQEKTFQPLGATPGCQGRRSDHCRHQQGSWRAGPRRPISPGFVLPCQRGVPGTPSPATAQRGHPHAGGSFHRPYESQER